MLKVNSKKAIRRLSNRSFKANVSRNVIAVIAIALTAILFTALFTVGSGMVENIQRQTMRQAGGDGMLYLKYMTDEQFDAVKNHPLIDRISYNRSICDRVESDALLKRHAEIYYMNDVGMDLGFCVPTHGHKPEKENEIIMDTRAMKMLGLPEVVGAPVTFRLKIHDGKIVERDFVLSGWWEADPTFDMASIMVVSKAYIDAHIDELYNSYYENYEMTGVVNSYIMCKNSFGLERKLERIITESGYSMDKNASNYIASNVNWSYMASNFDFDLPTVAGALAAIALIIFTGYLIIYNIFQISVIKDIRFYGLLKTIGTTGRQIKKIIRWQALILSCIGIPLGLIAGYFIGTAIVPLVMNNSSYAGTEFTTSANPMIFIGSIIFALITVVISTAKPGRIAASVSPVEAVRYTDNTNTKKKNRKTRGGAKISGMAAANLGRNKKRTALVVVSMTLSLVLFNTIYTLSIGFDMDKYLSTFVETDFLVSHASLINYTYSGEDDTVTERMISAIESQNGFKEGGCFFANIRDVECFRVKDRGNETLWRVENKDNDGNFFCAVYGLDDFPLGNLRVLEGNIDYEKLKSGEYILEGVYTDDNHNPMWETSHYNIGETVTLCNYKGDGETAGDNEYTEYQYKVMAKVAVNTFTNSCRMYYGHSYYLPAEVYKTMVANPGVMSYVYDVEDGSEAAMDAFLQNYTENVEPVMAYSSKNTKAKEFEGLRNTVIIVGGMLSLIIGLIGVLNFINSMLTSILTRKREFAMLQSIGMTSKQLVKMLITEGLIYTASAGAVSIALGAGVSALLANTIAKSLWFFTYQFTLMPLIMTIPILLIIGILLPIPVLKSVEKQSIVDRLRETEA
uniref:Efflux ABC transporter permease n=1 Tax=uncultured Bacillota bacterium TaxID=344338 RepID=A0A650EP50_9FIRM|nr:efflux ABC transporter permease [uncultured Firmicutes bacterium]